MSEKNEILNECCTDCGCSADIGTVISEDDTNWECFLDGSIESLKEVISEIEEAALEVCKDAKISKTEENSQVKISVCFSCMAEKLIFQLKTGRI
jgi:uncharacterized protein YfcZ (UPF0381/DUF406 family)